MLMLISVLTYSNPVDGERYAIKKKIFDGVIV